METYDNKKRQDRGMMPPAKRSEDTVPFVDQRESAMQQKKLIDTIHSVPPPTGFHSPNGTIQRMGLLAKNLWGKFSEEQKTAFCTKHKLAATDPYFTDDENITHDKKVRFFNNALLKAQEGQREAEAQAAAKALEAMPVPTGPAYTSLVKTDTKEKTVGLISLTIPQMDFEGVIGGGGVNIRITMPPIPTLPEGTVIGFIQVVKSPLVTAAAKTRADRYKEEHVEEEGAGWTIDRQGTPDPKNPYYGVNNDESGSSNCTLGSNTTPAVMLDAPSYHGLQAWSPRFETTAVIKACPIEALVGTALATVEWGFDRTPPSAATATAAALNEVIAWNPTHPQQLASPSAKFAKAVEVWNTLYAEQGDWKKIPDIH